MTSASSRPDARSTPATSAPRGGVRTTDDPADSKVSVSVVICAHSEDRWESLTEAVASVVAQSHRAEETLVVADHNERLLARANNAFSGIRVIASEGPPGLSGARNTGIRYAQGDVVAFLDDDARAHHDWLAAMVPWYADPQVDGVGGWVEPRWLADPPDWMPPELFWVIGCSFRGLPTTAASIRNPIGANMSFRRAVLRDTGGFRHQFARVGTGLMTCDETEFTIRALARRSGSVMMHVPEARVDHAVPARRTTWRYFISRCWAEGRSKALVAASVGPHAALATERAYTIRVLPRGVAKGLAAMLRGDRYGLSRAGAIIAALAVTGAGYGLGRTGRLIAEARSRDT